MGKLIDIEDIFGEKVIMVSQNAYDEVMKLMRMIREAPEVDAVPVVRCKDCLWGKWNNALWNSIYCESIGMDRDLNDYCSMGERKEEG